MEKQSFLAKMSIKQKIIMLTVLVASLLVVTSLFITAKNIKTQLVNQYKTQITNITELVSTVLTEYDKKVAKKELTLQQAQQMAINDVNNIR